MIEESFRKLSNDDKADVMEGTGLSAEPTFPGWDADSEANYKSIARFMVERIRLFPTFRSRASRASGGAVVRRYRQMLRHFTAWGKDVTDRDLSKSELVELLEIFGSGAGGAAAQSPVVSQGD
jgi:uncharacterized protein YfbU (UPF0304 family)